MAKFRLTVAAAESVTCGHLQARIGETPEIAEVFKGGITTYSIEHKVKHLGVDAVHATKTNCVSTRVADQMAVGVCCLFGVEVGVATTGYAAAPRKGRGPYAFWSLCRNDGACLKIVKRGQVIGPVSISRQAMQAKVAEAAFQALSKYVQENSK